MKSYSELFKNAPLRIVSRQSKLAMVQTEMVTALLGDVPNKITGLSTSGDEVLDRPLVEIGGKGVFIKALEVELMEGRADCAVHSLKDMETIIAPQTAFQAVLPRADRRDALVGPFATIDELPQGAVIGTSSVRRAALLRHYRPDLEIALLRGNVQRRLSQLEEGHFDAIILAKAGLDRLGLGHLGSPLDEKVMMPSASQGVIAIQISEKDSTRKQAMQALFDEMNCQDTFAAITAERSLLSKLDGSCRTPIGAMADLDDKGQITLHACVLSADGSARFDATMKGAIDEAERLGHEVGEALLKQCGGRAFLA